MVSLILALTGVPVWAIELKGGTSQETFLLTDDVDTAQAQVDKYPEDPEAYFLLAVAYSRTPYFEKAFQAAKKAKKLIKQSPEGYAKFDGKIGEYEKMRDANPDDTRVLYRLGFAYFMKGYALEKNYIKDSPDTPAKFYTLAEQHMRKVIALDPKDIWARNYLGYLLVDADENANLDKAIALWEESLAMNAENPGANFMLGQAYLKKGDLRKALQYGAKGLAARQSAQ